MVASRVATVVREVARRSLVALALVAMAKIFSDVILATMLPLVILATLLPLVMMETMLPLMAMILTLLVTLLRIVTKLWQDSAT